MLPVEQPFKTYSGLNGQPLENGFVYFGQPELDPLINPVSVFWDAGGTIPAEQPLRTVGGYIMRNGTPANVFLDGPYSEIVLDSKGRQVFYARNSDDFSIRKALLSTLRGEDGKSYRAFGYVVRNDGTGWRYIDDIDHRPTNMSTVSVEGDSLRVSYSITGKRVLTHIVGTDETMSALGVTCGPSVGLTYSDIKMYMPFACWVEYVGGVWQFGSSDGINPWFGPGTDTTIATSPDGSQFTITHKTASGTHPPTFAVLTQAASDAPGNEIRMSYGGTSIIGTAHSLFEGYIAWTGPGPNDWTVSTPNVAKPTCAFAGGVLTVTHENLGPDTKAVSIDAVSGIYLPASGTSITGNSFQVVFQDYAGVTITEPNANMKFRYMRPRPVRSKAADGMRVAMQRGPVQLNPANVVSGNGNFWGYGVMEME